jgi:hypothetical protein
VMKMSSTLQKTDCGRMKRKREIEGGAAEEGERLYSRSCLQKEGAHISPQRRRCRRGAAPVYPMNYLKMHR